MTSNFFFGVCEEIPVIGINFKRDMKSTNISPFRDYCLQLPSVRGVQ